MQLAPPLPVTMPALQDRPKLSNAMARALHKHIMRERDRKRQGEISQGWLGLTTAFLPNHNQKARFFSHNYVVVIGVSFLPNLRGGRGGQDDGAEDERGRREKENKRDRGEDVLGGDQRTGQRKSKQHTNRWRSIREITCSP